MLGSKLSVGVSLGYLLALGLKETLGQSEGAFDTLGMCDTLGQLLGVTLGTALGFCDGLTVG